MNERDRCEFCGKPPEDSTLEEIKAGLTRICFPCYEEQEEYDASKCSVAQLDIEDHYRGMPVKEDNIGSQPRIVITMEGGLIQNVYSDRQVEICIIDFDCDYYSETEIRKDVNGECASVTIGFQDGIDEKFVNECFDGLSDWKDNWKEVT